MLVWFAILLLLTLAVIGLTAVLLVGLSYLIGTPLVPLAFRYGLWLQPTVWGVGTVVAYRRYRSISLTFSLIVMGVVTFVLLPVLLYLTVIVATGGFQTVR